MIRQSQPNIYMDRSCIFIKEVPKYYQLNLLFIESVSNIIYWQSILHNPGNCLIVEYNANLSFKDKLSILRKCNINKIIVAHLNINSLGNKFDSLIDQITGNIDILMVSETKLDESFPIGQFITEGFSVPYKLEWNTNGEGVTLFVREDIPSRLLSVENSPTEATFCWDKHKKKDMVTQLLLQSKERKHRKSPGNVEQKFNFIFI